MGTEIEDLPIEWFLREDVQKNIHAKSRAVARLAIKLDIDYRDDASLMKCLEAFVPLTSLTSEELTYALEYTAAICSYESMADKGWLIYIGEGYQLTDAGLAHRRELVRSKFLST